MIRAQIDSVGSGHALSFDGINSYVDLGNIYDDLTFPFTISAWVHLDSTSGPSPIFVSQGQDDLPTYKGFWFFVSPTTLWIEYGDGTGGDNPAFRRGKTAPVTNLAGRWVHVCGVVKSEFDINLSVNGINVGGSSSGDSDLPMDSNFPTEVARIGYLTSNGIRYHFKGKMDDIQFFNRALSQAEICQNMTKKLTGKEPGLIGYWTFDETSGNTLTDKSSNHYDGQLRGGTKRIYSGAPIGDENILLYTSNWSGTKVIMNDGLHHVEVSNVKANAGGIHIYEVKNLPSQTGGLDLSALQKPYFGVFVASLSSAVSFDVNYKYDNNQDFCKRFTRVDNSQSLWMDNNSALVNINSQLEFIKSQGEVNDINFDLGADRILCDQASYSLSTGIDITGKSFLWSTGEISSSIVVTQSNKYLVQVSEGCKSSKDSVQITFLKSPPFFSLGMDQEMCSLKSTLLKPLNDTTDFEFTWQDGSKKPSFLVTDYGTYWVTVKNACGSITDSLILKDKNKNSTDFEIELGADQILCNQSSRVISLSSIDLSGKSILWSTGDTSIAISVHQSGKYSVSVSEDCKNKKDSVQITFLKSPPFFSLGMDQEMCSLKSTLLKPLNDTTDFEFTWQDGSKKPSFLVTDYGTYWVTVKNTCGSTTDSLILKNKRTDKIFIPNIITPNTTDTLNHFFEIDKRIVTPQLFIYDRWGIQVYSSAHYQNNWDGNDLSSGIYFYRIVDNCIGELKGSLNILR